MVLPLMETVIVTAPSRLSPRCARCWDGYPQTGPQSVPTMSTIPMREMPRCFAHRGGRTLGSEPLEPPGHRGAARKGKAGGVLVLGAPHFFPVVPSPSGRLGAETAAHLSRCGLVPRGVCRLAYRVAVAADMTLFTGFDDADDVWLHDDLDDAQAQAGTTLDESEFVVGPTDLSLVEIRRSTRRRKSVIAYREDGKTIVVAPARMSQADVEAFVRELVGRLDQRALRNSGQQELLERAKSLVASYFDHDVLAAHPVDVTISWVTNQNSRWGSCTPGVGKIRLSHRLHGAPDYVIDSVLMHELAHLVVLNHGPRFREIVERYPHNSRAEAFLAGITHAERLGGGTGS